MTVAVVPFKGPEAKSRLAPVLSEGGRRRLARALLTHVIDVLHGSPAIDLVAVVAPAPVDGGVWIPDPGRGLNAALLAAMTWTEREGHGGLVIVPADLPHLHPDDVAALVGALPSVRALVLAPSVDGGTGALGLRPPTAIMPAFGPGSAARHVLRGRAAGLTVRLCRRPGFELDVDVPDDLARLAAHAPHGHARSVR